MAGSVRTVKTGKDSPSFTACCPLSGDNESVPLLVHLTSTSCDFLQTPWQHPHAAHEGWVSHLRAALLDTVLRKAGVSKEPRVVDVVPTAQGLALNLLL